MEFFIENMSRDYSSFGATPPRILGYKPWFTDFDRNVEALAQRLATVPPAPTHGAELVVAAKIDDVLVGIMLLSFSREGETDDPHVILEDILIREEVRNDGIGETMLEWAEEQARLEGFGRWYLETSIANTAAQRFFQKHGFKPRAVIMERERGF